MSPRKTSTSDPKAGRTRQQSNPSTAYTSPRKGPRPSTSKPSSLPPPPKPVADIGTPVRVTGRVVHTSKGRQVLVDEIREFVEPDSTVLNQRIYPLPGPCSSPNDEPNHWIAVLELHRTRYFAEHLGPFVVPPLKKRAQPAWIPKSPEKDKGKARATDTSISPGKSVRMDTGVIEPQTPSSSGLASTDGSPVSSSSRHSLRQVCRSGGTVLMHGSSLPASVSSSSSTSNEAAQARTDCQYLPHLPQALHGQRAFA